MKMFAMLTTVLATLGSLVAANAQPVPADAPSTVAGESLAGSGRVPSSVSGRMSPAID